MSVSSPPSQEPPSTFHRAGNRSRFFFASWPYLFLAGILILFVMEMKGDVFLTQSTKQSLLQHGSIAKKNIVHHSLPSWKSMGDTFNRTITAGMTSTTAATTTSSPATENLDDRLNSAHALSMTSSSPMPSPLSTSSNTTTTTRTTSDFAYAFVVGGCQPERPTYRGFLYDVLVSTRILRHEGSNQDVLLFVQMSSRSTATTLPEADARPLQAMGVHVTYLDKSPTESFYETVLQKFRILTLTQYQRVMLLDADLMPVQNLDYLFYLSTGRDNLRQPLPPESIVSPIPNKPILKGNVVVAGTMEPANAGFFILTPRQGDYERLLEIVQDRERRDQESGGFNVTTGWGHVIAPPDEWKARVYGNKQDRGTQWDFLFAYSDQGLCKLQRDTFIAGR